MKKYIFYAFVILLLLNCNAQNVVIENKDQSETDVQKQNPKLLVAIVVDQMRYDYLTRFDSKYGNGGFKRLINNGFNCKNNHFNYIPTKTGPGHASIFTGTTPKYHGIIGNDWFDYELMRNVNCVTDNSIEPIGTNYKDGKMSPHRLITNTFADENRLFTQMKGKTIGISIKHRGAILPAGHSANAAYWFDYKKNGTGNWISSSYYMNKLPDWVNDFNNSDITESYFKVWDTFYNIDTYIESGRDNNKFEGGFKGKDEPTFPYDLPSLREYNDQYNIIAETPFGNSLTTDFTIAAIEAEGLGQDNITDVLTVSYSSTDKVGHNFGVNSKEIEDTYIRLDKDIERLLTELDNKVGKGNYTTFLTADHGAPHAPAYLQSHGIPGGFFDNSKMLAKLNSFLLNKYNLSKLVLSRINNQIYLDRKKIKENKLPLNEIKNSVANELLKYRLITKVYITSEINHFQGQEGFLETMLRNGHNQKRSGDIIFEFSPAVLSDTPWNRTGTNHYTGFNYDTHIPLIFYGKGIKKGETDIRTDITDIAPTISTLLNISFPNGAIGNPIEVVLE
ncbi:MAG: alkaline phosphatase family protein [Flavobacteriaceae bacterium]|nr:alkaline phosphatase family protein [Bacteroidia bacterium]NNL16651.1 alkaline phosphatase family protein [Flavobacteriaceae bacterium]